MVSDPGDRSVASKLARVTDKRKSKIGSCLIVAAAVSLRVG